MSIIHGCVDYIIPVTCVFIENYQDLFGVFQNKYAVNRAATGFLCSVFEVLTNKVFFGRLLKPGHNQRSSVNDVTYWL